MRQTLKTPRRWLHLIQVLLIGCLGVTHSAIAQTQAAQLRVYAAASLTEVLQELSKQYQAQTGIAIEFSFAASSTLARQIEAGARADVFISADIEWMDYLAQRRAIQSGTRRNLTGNGLVLIAPADSVITLALRPKADLAGQLNGSRLALADPDSVPAGKYARAALINLGLWSSVSEHLVLGDNVRTALNFVSRGEAPLGIVYATDARADDKVKIVDVFPANTHAPIVYPVAATTDAAPQAKSFIEWLLRPQAQAIFQRYGFAPLKSPWP